MELYGYVIILSVIHGCPFAGGMMWNGGLPSKELIYRYKDHIRNSGGGFCFRIHIYIGK